MALLKKGFTILPSQKLAASDLGNEVLHDVGRIVIGHILTMNHDCVCERLRMVLQQLPQQNG